MDTHPRFPLRPRTTQYEDPPIIFKEYFLSTTDDWEPTLEGRVRVSLGISGAQHRKCSIYVKGGGVEMHLVIENLGSESVVQIQEIASRIPNPVTFQALTELGFKYVRYTEPQGT